MVTFFFHTNTLYYKFNLFSMIIIKISKFYIIFLMVVDILRIFKYNKINIFIRMEELFWT